MGISCPQLSVFLYIQQQSDLELQLARISESQNMLSYQRGLYTMNNEDWYKDPKVKLLQIKENLLDMEKLKIETNLKAINSNLEAQEKLIANNVKDEFGYKLSI